MRIATVSTIDNPYSPFENFREWYAFDERMGYHTTALLGRVAVVSQELSEADYQLAIENAIDEIVRENTSGMFIKLIKEVDDSEFEVPL